MPPDEALPRSERLRGKRQWQAVFSGGTRLHGRYAALWWRRQEGAGRRVGFSAGKRAGPPIVRNRARRLLKEAYRRMKHNVPTDCHIVLVAKPGLGRAGYDEVLREVRLLLRRAGLWSDSRA